jgi:hypothetical protein
MGHSEKTGESGDQERERQAEPGHATPPISFLSSWWVGWGCHWLSGCP